MKLFKKKESLKERLLKNLDEYQEAYRVSEDENEKKILQENISKIQEQLVKLECSNKDGTFKIIAAVVAFLGALVPVGLTISNYNLQYKRERKELDEAQLGMQRSKFSAANNIKRP